MTSQTSLAATDADNSEATWNEDRTWWVGRHNSTSLANHALTLPDRVTLVDSTLREGEETPGTRLTVGEKVDFAHYLASVGFTELEVGYAGVIDEHFQLMRDLKAGGIGARLAFWGLRGYVRRT
jgi:hypothetical protein